MVIIKEIFIILFRNFIVVDIYITDVNTKMDNTSTTMPENKSSEETVKIDPYEYLKRDEFTSEIYKIEIKNLPRYTGHKVSLTPS